MNIDETRIETSDNLNGGTYSKNGKAGPMLGDTRTGKDLGMFSSGAKPKIGFIQPIGRWPANVLHDGRVIFPEASIPCGSIKKTNGSGGLYRMGSAGAPGRIYSDSGSASRFFKSIKEYKTEGE